MTRHGFYPSTDPDVIETGLDRRRYISHDLKS
jgi:hypothetical protein